MEVRLKEVYILSVEPPGDYIFSPSGVVILMQNEAFKVYCVSSSHNLYRAALNKHSWDQLEEGIVFKDTGFRLTSVTAEITERGWTDAESIPNVLTYLFSRNPKHLFFLKRHIEPQ